MISKSLIVVLSIIFILGSSHGVYANLYVFEKGLTKFTEPQTIKQAEYYQDVYGYLGDGADRVDYYDLSFSEYTPQVKIELLVPDRKETDGFRPSFIFVDPHQAVMNGKVPFGFPESVGGKVYDWTDLTEKKITDETVLENLILGPSLVKDLVANRYVIAVYNPESRGGRYVLRVGAKKYPEGIKEKFLALLALIRIKLLIY